MTPEETARQEIDAQLAASGWIVQDYTAADFSTGRGIALREVPLATGPCDYLLLVDRQAVGVVEAKKQGTTLSTVAEQSGRYAASLPPLLAAGLTGNLPFLYESTGVETFFRDERDPAPRSRWQSSNWSPACREIASPTCSATNCCVPPHPSAQITGKPAARDQRLSSSPKSATPSGKPMSRSIGSNSSPNLARLRRRSSGHTCRRRANSWRSLRQSSRTPKAMTTVVDLSVWLQHFAFCLLPFSFPSVAVTVDMIATGTDIKPLEVLLFLRDVRSRVYFEQMKGRGTRVLSPTDLQSVSGEDARAKTRFVIVDAVGVCETDKTESHPLA